ncbi:MAG: hypothetical protein ACXVBX_13415, partial [Flavisolibacter sp.]
MKTILLALSLATFTTISVSAQKMAHHEFRHDTKDIRHDRNDVRHDKKDIAGDTKDIRSDKK